MPQVTIQYKDAKALQALMDLAKYFDFSVKSEKKARRVKKNIPIDFADDPDVTALAGIWEGKEVTLEQLRKNAWGDRL